MPVGPKFRRRLRIEKIKPMPAGREFVAGLRRGVIAIEGGGECCDRPRGDRVGAGFGLAYPLAQ